MSNNWRHFFVILKKEVIDNLRDRRTLTTMAVSVLATPLLLFSFLWFIEKTVDEETDLVRSDPVELAVIGAQYAPNLIDYLEQNNIAVNHHEGDPEAAVRAGGLLMMLVIDESYSTALATGELAPLRLIHDSSNAGLKSIGFNTVRGTLNRYANRLGALRLQARGINPMLVRAIHVNVSDVAAAEARSSGLLNMLPYLLIIFIMLGGLYLAIDTTAGERENHSLESLLTLPVKRQYVVLAKLAATVVFSAVTFLLVLIGLALSFTYLPIDSIAISMSVAKIAIIFFSCLPLVFAGCALMVLVASFTKSYKEAQSYLSMVLLLPSLPLMVLGLLAPQPSVSNMWVPSLSQGLIIIETLKGDMIAGNLLALSVLSTLFLAAVLSYIAVKLYQRERILG